MGREKPHLRWIRTVQWHSRGTGGRQFNEDWQRKTTPRSTNGTRLPQPRLGEH